MSSADDGIRGMVRCRDWALIRFRVTASTKACWSSNGKGAVGFATPYMVPPSLVCRGIAITPSDPLFAINTVGRPVKPRVFNRGLPVLLLRLRLRLLPLLFGILITGQYKFTPPSEAGRRKFYDGSLSRIN
jgi:hypothetical protein